LLFIAPVSVLAGQDQGGDHALFWSIQKNDEPVGYLLGTIHREDPRVLAFSEEFSARAECN